MSEADERQSPLRASHEALGATLMSFGGWLMPLDYGSVLAEHAAVREDVAMFDLSHLGVLEVYGDRAAEVVATALTVDAEGLAEGRAAYALCLNDRAGVVDDVLVYRLPGRLMVVPNAANTDAVRERLGAVDGAEVRDLGAATACIAVQGPRSVEVVVRAGVDVERLDYLDCRETAGPGWTARTGYTGELGYELFVGAEEAPGLWDRLHGLGVTPAGLGARDTLRLEMGYPLHGQDLHEEVDPVAAGLRWAVRSPRDFNGRAAYEALVEQGPARRLRGLRIEGRGIPRPACTVRVGDREVGRTTSGTFSPTLRVGVALAYVDAEVPLGERVGIEVRRRMLTAEIVRPPFVAADPRAGGP